MEPQTGGQPKPKKQHHIPQISILHGGLAVILFSFVAGFLGAIGAIRVFDLELGTSGTFEPITKAEELIYQEEELISDIFERVSPSVVSISVQSEPVTNVFGETFTNESAGSGIIISEDGLILTNKHVIPEGSDSLTVTTTDGQEFNRVRVVGRDPFNDIAFLKVRGAENLPKASFGDSSEVRVGDKVVAIGNALGEFSNTVTSGIISGLSRPIEAGSGSQTESLQNLFQTDAAINPGNSGGPLVNINGEIIGINTAVAGNAENIGFAIPINDVKSDIESVEQTGELIKPYLGVRYITITESVANELDLTVNKGALVIGDSQNTAIILGSPAAKAGIKENDIIVRINDKEIDENNSLVAVIGEFSVDEEVTVVILRNNQQIELDAILERAPEG